MNKKLHFKILIFNHAKMLSLKCLSSTWKCDPNAKLSENILFHCTKSNFMDMQKPGPRGRLSNTNPGPGAAVKCKTLGGHPQGDVGTWN